MRNSSTLFVVLFAVAFCSYWVLTRLVATGGALGGAAVMPADPTFATWRYGIEPADAATLRGAVTDAAGQPLAAVEVWLVEQFGDMRNEHVATTGSDGTFGVEFVRPRAYRIALRRAGWLPHVESITLGQGQAAEVDLRWPAGADVTVTVVEAASGEPVEGVAVHSFRARTGRRYTAREFLDTDPRFFAATAVTAEDGVAELHGVPPGARNLVVRSPDHAPAIEAHRVVAAGAPNDAEIRLGRGATLTGRVLAADGRPAADAEVWIARTRELELRLVGFEFAANGVRTDAEGAYRIERIPAGTLHAMAVGADGAVAFASPGPDPRGLEVGDGSEVTLDLTLVAPVRRWQGVVRDGSGAPVPGAKVTVLTRDLRLGRETSFRLRGAITSLRHEAVADGQGRYEFRGLRRSWQPLACEVRAAGHDDLETVFDTQAAPDEVVRDIELVPYGAPIAGRIDGPQGLPRAGVSVMARQPEKGGGAWFGTTDASGNYAIAIPRGETGTLDVKITNAVDLGMFADPPVQRAAAGGRADFTLRPARIVEGTIVDASGNPVEDFTVAVARIGRLPTAADEAAGFEHLLSGNRGGGRFRVLCEPRDLGSSVLVVESREHGGLVVPLASLDRGQPDLRIEMPPRCEIAGRLVDGAGEPVEGAYVSVTTPDLAALPRRGSVTDASGAFTALAATPDIDSVTVHRVDTAGVGSYWRQEVPSPLPVPLLITAPADLRDVEITFQDADGSPVRGSVQIGDDLGELAGGPGSGSIDASGLLRLRLQQGEYVVAVVPADRANTAGLETFPLIVGAQGESVRWRVR